MLRLLVVASACAALAGCVITRPPRDSERPRWRIADDVRFDSGCAIGRAFIRKSGKTGFGVTLQWKSRGDCKVALDAVTLKFDRPSAALRVAARPGEAGAFDQGGKVAVPVIPPVDLPGRSLVYAWLPVPFDNNDAWNDGLDHATLELAVVVAGAPATPWRIPVVQR